MANVLIIDDDILMCDLLSRLVKKMGHDATSTFTLRDGLKEVHSGAFEVVFLDVGMPDGSGIEVIAKLNQNGKLVIITVYVL